MFIQVRVKAANIMYYAIGESASLILYLCKIAQALRVSKHVTESIRNIARRVGRKLCKMPGKSHVKTSCGVCLQRIVNGKEEAIFCEGKCQEWYHKSMRERTSRTLRYTHC